MWQQSYNFRLTPGVSASAQKSPLPWDKPDEGRGPISRSHRSKNIITSSLLCHVMNLSQAPQTVSQNIFLYQVTLWRFTGKQAACEYLGMIINETWLEWTQFVSLGDKIVQPLPFTPVTRMCSIRAEMEMFPVVFVLLRILGGGALVRRSWRAAARNPYWVRVLSILGETPVLLWETCICNLLTQILPQMVNETVLISPWKPTSDVLVGKERRVWNRAVIVCGTCGDEASCHLLTIQHEHDRKQTDTLVLGVGGLFPNENSN